MMRSMRALHAGGPCGEPQRAAVRNHATNVPRESNAPLAGDEQDAMTGRFAPDGERGAFFAHPM
jgi:hypothetical protein